MDMELVQFHPTGMLAPEEAAGTLVTEAVRGEGGRLMNAKGERFMERYDPQRMELSTRDRIALASYNEIHEGRGTPGGGVLLDITHRSKEYILEKLPRMYRQFIEYQMLDISKQPMEVAPTAHYSMGGIVVEPDTHATEVAGLFAAGECTSGLHGANRLGGNSLTEAVVFGRRAGEAAARFSGERDVQLRSRKVVEQANDELDALIKPGDELARSVQRAIRNLMWERCGVVREEGELASALERLHLIQAGAASIDVRPSEEGWSDLALALDVKAMLLTAEATVVSALERRESRGAHNRSDYPRLDPVLQVNFYTELSGPSGKLRVTSRPVPPVSRGAQCLGGGGDSDGGEGEAPGVSGG
jgi:succinate dehydrogenase / fumarate reductase flavoprotein subunit